MLCLATEASSRSSSEGVLLLRRLVSKAQLLKSHTAAARRKLLRIMKVPD